LEKDFPAGYSNAMTDKIDVAALAKLARLEVSEDEISSLERELPGILAFVETIRKAPIAEEAATANHRNVYRADENPHEGGAYTEDLLNAAPAREGDRIVVKQVITRKSPHGGSADK
jgi:aspartyl/glutamyl-tRNA(Asn/Gln) amidotransferase C subunit